MVIPEPIIDFNFELFPDPLINTPLSAELTELIISNELNEDEINALNATDLPLTDHEER
jgi:hypothetical protein